MIMSGMIMSGVIVILREKRTKGQSLESSRVALIRSFVRLSNSHRDHDRDLPRNPPSSDHEHDLNDRDRRESDPSCETKQQRRETRQFTKSSKRREKRIDSNSHARRACVPSHENDRDLHDCDSSDRAQRGRGRRAVSKGNKRRSVESSEAGRERRVKEPHRMSLLLIIRSMRVIIVRVRMRRMVVALDSRRRKEEETRQFWLARPSSAFKLARAIQDSHRDRANARRKRR